MRRVVLWVAIVLGGVVAVVLLLGAGVVAVGRAQNQRLERALEPFYTPLDPLPPGQPGDLIRQEALDAPEGVRAWRVLYRSTTFDGTPAAVSGLIAVPDQSPPPGGFPVVAVAHGTVGVARICAPSLNPFQPRSVLPSFLARDKKGESPYEVEIKPFIDAGYAVAATDYRGLGTPGPSPYLVGEDEARNVLDSIRAIRRFPGIAVSDQTLVWGHSQGGHSAAFTGQFAARYAPEIRPAGVVLGAPAAELGLMSDAIAAQTERSPLTGLFAIIVWAWTGTFPSLDSATVMTRRGVNRLPVVGEQCVVNVLLAFGFRPATQFIRGSGIRSAPWQAQIETNTAGNAGIPVPIRLYQGASDQVIHPEWSEAYRQRLCAIGDTVAYQEYPGLGHLDVIGPSMPDTLAWMADRLSGRPAPRTC
jgi:alpha-beta hydrolase superfamily lysophospholipase